MIHPGHIPTGMNPADPDQNLGAPKPAGSTALAHHGTADAIAEVVTFPAGPAALYTIGSAWAVDGEMTAW